MSRELDILAEILKRNSDDQSPLAIDIENEMNHYFFFDAIKNEVDREAAWSVFDEQLEIRNRLSTIENHANKVTGWGYRIPKHHARCSDDKLIALVAAHIAKLRPILLEEDYNAPAIAFIDGGFSIEIAPAGIAVPEPAHNDLFLTLGEAVSDYWTSHFPYEKRHYQVLNNWAIYLTKCDEVAAYLMWPCLKHEKPLDPQMMEAGVELWKLDCANRYWVKDEDYAGKVLYVRPPWLDE